MTSLSSTLDAVVGIGTRAKAANVHAGPQADVFERREVLILLSSYVALPLAWAVGQSLGHCFHKRFIVERAAIFGGGTRLTDNGRLEMQERAAGIGGE